MTRKEANLEIAKLLKHTALDIKYHIADIFKALVEQFPEQRAGQIFCNYIIPEYRTNPDERTKQILDTLFPKNSDPFFEESIETLKRL